MTRLSRTTLSGLTAAPDLILPAASALDAAPGIVHFGIGAFHRAHQAVITQEAMESTGDYRWGITGVTQRSANVKHQLEPQDGLYSVLVRATEGDSLRVVSSVRDVIFPAEHQAELDALFEAASVQIVTLTVTEKGYRRRGDGHLDLDDAAVAADLRGDVATSAVGRLVRGLQRRMRTVGTPMTVVACDNLNSNGAVLHQLVSDFCAALPEAEGSELAAWISENVSFPCTMVDRIVPATTDADREDGRKRLGLEDAGLVVAEPFLQWVIEDDFRTDRPAWEKGGAQFTSDVAPFELMKLRILNGSHSSLAYLGALRGYPTIARTVQDPELLQVAEHLELDDVIPTLETPEDTDLVEYAASVRHRFANPALAHKTTQIAMDGSQKLPQRLLGTIRDRIEQGAEAHYATTGVAAWMSYIASERGKDGLELPVNDPLAERLTSIARGKTDAKAIVGGLLGVTEVFGEDLPQVDWFRQQLVEDVDRLIVR